MSGRNKPEMSRRRWFQSLAGLGAAVTLPSCSPKQRGADAGLRRTRQKAANLIRSENQLPGTRKWLLDNPRIDPRTKYRCPWIEGYCSRASVRAGDAISLFVSTNPESRFTIEIYRMGYYEGAGARAILKLGPFRGRSQ